MQDQDETGPDPDTAYMIVAALNNVAAMGAKEALDHAIAGLQRQYPTGQEHAQQSVMSLLAEARERLEQMISIHESAHAEWKSARDKAKLN
jgi:hypothetical protein